MKKYLMVILLSGCATTSQIVEPIKIDVMRTPPQHGMTSCVMPLKLTDGKFNTVIEKLKETVDLLGECSLKHDELVDFINKK